MLLSYVASSGGEFVGKQGRQWWRINRNNFAKWDECIKTSCLALVWFQQDFERWLVLRYRIGLWFIWVVKTASKGFKKILVWQMWTPLTRCQDSNERFPRNMFWQMWTPLTRCQDSNKRFQTTRFDKCELHQRATPWPWLGILSAIRNLLR